jgi:lipoyl(octanoyl) transferase
MTSLPARFLGRDVPYDEGMAVMRAAIADVDARGPVLLLLEHEPVVTITRSGGTRALTTSPEAMAQDGIRLVETDRGGDVTFHGPGQLTGYVVVRIARDPLAPRTDALPARPRVVEYVRALEQGLVDAARALGVHDARGDETARGVWVGDAKLVAIGVGVGRGVTRHGFAFNVTTDLPRYTRHIVPCGLVGRPVTSLARVLAGPLPSDEHVRDVVATCVGDALARFATTTVPHFPLRGDVHG